MAKRNGPIHGPARQAGRARDRGGPRTASERLRARRFLQDHELREAPARSRIDRRLVTGAGHRRRGPARQELEYGRRASPEAHRQSIRDRAHGNAAGKQARRADLDRPVRRSASPGADLEAPARPPGQGRGRSCHRLSGAGQDWRDPGARHDPAAQIRGAAATAEPHRPERSGADDRAADEPASRECGHGGQDRTAGARSNFSRTRISAG